MKSLPLKNELFPLGYVTGNGQIIMSYIVMYNLVFNIIQRINSYIISVLKIHHINTSNTL